MAHKFFLASAFFLFAFGILADSSRAQTDEFQFDANAKATPAVPPETDAALDLEIGDHICLIGNALGERMQHRNHWETLLHQIHADKELTVRNLCFPGDTVDLRLRSLNFGSPDVHLARSRASVILMFFGANEAFKGKEGVDQFGEELDQLVQNTKTKMNQTPPNQ